MTSTFTPASSQFCRSLGIDHPIVLAPMGGGPSTPELVAAVSEGGGLGTIAAGYLTAQALEESLAAVRHLTGRAVGVNVFVPPPGGTRGELRSAVASALEEISTDLGIAFSPPEPADPRTFDDQIDVVEASDAAIVSFTFGLPPRHTIESLQRTGKIVAATANTISDAQHAVDAGSDIVIVQGFEAGAHRGGPAARSQHHIGLISLLEHARQRITVPVVASGGIASGAGIAACLTLGAAAVQIGTTFLVAQESGASPEWKDAVVQSADADTLITPALTGRNARGINNELIARLNPLLESRTTPHSTDSPPRSAPEPASSPTPTTSRCGPANPEASADPAQPARSSADYLTNFAPSLRTSTNHGQTQHPTDSKKRPLGESRGSSRHCDCEPERHCCVVRQ